MTRPFGSKPMAFAVACAFLLAQTPAFALPTGWEVIQGDVNIEQNGNILTITSASDQAIINYITFNLASGETINFILPSINSNILNRVIGGSASSIAGNIISNGGIAIVNSSGINIANTAQLQAARVLLSSLNISDQSFLSGNQQFVKDPTKAGAVVNNEGLITVQPGGSVQMVGSAVSNSGLILAPDGQIHLAVGDKITIGLSNYQSIQVTVDEALKESVDGLNAAIKNSGGMQAHQIELAAKLADAPIQQAIENSGVIQGTALANVGGKIKVVGSSDTKNALVTNSGLLYAGATSESAVAGEILLRGDMVTNTDAIIANGGIGEQGGRIEILGDSVVNMHGAYLEASGDTGGGTILVGGDYQGTGDTYRAQYNYVDQSVIVNNDAITSGDGGKTIFWSDKTTNFKGNIIARGGLESGNGGFAEVSGHGYLDFTGFADLTAANGNKGTLLLDPTDINITSFNITTALAPVFHIDASNAGSITITGGAVSQWNDISGNGRNFTQGVAGSRPVVVAGAQNGLDIVRFSSDNMNGAALGVGATSDWNYFVLVKATGYTNGAGNDGAGSYIMDRTAATNNLTGLKMIGNKFALQKRDDGGGGLAGISSTTSVNTGAYQLVQWGRDYLNQFRVYVDGTLEGTASDAGGGNYTPPIPKLGSHQGGGGALNADFAEMLMISSDISLANRQALEQTLYGKWGVNVSTAFMNTMYLGAGTSTLADTYLEALSQTSNISLVASNNINIGNLSDNLLALGGTSTLTMNAGNQIIFADTNDVIRTEGRAIDLTATNGMTLGTLNTRGAAGNLNSTITLNSNGATTWTALNAGTGTVTVAPSTNATAVGVGGGAGAINLTTAKINTITAGTIQVGSNTMTGAVNLNQANFTVPSSNVTLNTTGAIVTDASAPNITLAAGDTLTITGGGGTGAGNVGTVGTRLKTTVDNLTINSTGDVYVSETNAVSVGGDINGLFNFNTLAAGNVTLANLDVAGATTMTLFGTNSNVSGNTGLIFRGAATFNTNDNAGGDIDLTGDFQGNTSVTGDRIQLTDTAGNLAVTTFSTGTTGANNLITVNAGNLSLDGITLDSSGATNAGRLDATASGTVSIDGTGWNTTGDTINAWSTGGGGITLADTTLLGAVPLTGTAGSTNPNQAGAGIYLRTTGAYILNNNSIANNTSITSDSTITGTGNTFTGTTAFDANTGTADNINITNSDFQSVTNTFDGANVNLSATSNFTISGATTTGTLDVNSLTANRQIDLANIDAGGAATMSVSGNGDIAGTVGLLFRNTATFNAANNGGNITLTGDFQGNSNFTGDRVQVTDNAGAFAVTTISTGVTAATSTLSATGAGGDITVGGITLDSGGAAASGRLDVNAADQVTINGTGWNSSTDILNAYSTGSGIMTLTNTTLTGTDPLTGTTGNTNPNSAVAGVYLRTGGAYVINNNSINNNTSITSDSTITGTGNTFTGTTAFDANTGTADDISITNSNFANATNTFDGANVTVSDTNALTISGITASGTASLTATGAGNTLAIDGAAVTGNTTLTSGGAIDGANTANNYGTLTATGNGLIEIYENGTINVNSVTNNHATANTTLHSATGSIIGKGTAVADIVSAGTGQVGVVAGTNAANVNSYSDININTGGPAVVTATGESGGNMSIRVRGDIAGTLLTSGFDTGTFAFFQNTGNVILGDATDNINVTGTTSFNGNNTTDITGQGSFTGAVSGTGGRVGLEALTGNFTSGGITATGATGWYGAADETMIIQTRAGDIQGAGYTTSALGNMRLQAGVSGTACTGCDINVTNVSAAQNLGLYARGDTTGAGNGNSIVVGGTSNTVGSILASGVNAANQYEGTQGAINLTMSSGNLTTGLVWAGNDNINLTASNGSILQNSAAYPWSFWGKTIHTSGTGDVTLRALGGAGSYIDTGVNCLGAGCDLTAQAQGQSGGNISIQLYGRVDGGLAATNNVGGNTTGDVNLGTSVGILSDLNDVYTVQDVTGNTFIRSARDVRLYGYYGNTIDVVGRTLTGVADKGNIAFSNVNLSGVAGTVLNMSAAHGSILGGNITTVGAGNVFLSAGTATIPDKMNYVNLTNVTTAGNLTVWAAGSTTGNSSGNSITITGSTAGSTTVQGAGGVGSPVGTVSTP